MPFCVEHLAKASQRRSLRLVRTIPVHLMSMSEVKYEFSAAGSVVISLTNNEYKGILQWVKALKHKRT